MLVILQERKQYNCTNITEPPPDIRGEVRYGHGEISEGR